MKNPQDIQQALRNFKTTLVVGGPLTVRVHKALDTIYAGSNRHGYFISVDFKFTESNALNVGKPGYEGLSKTEATRAANALAKDIASHHAVMLRAEEHAKQNDTQNARITAALQAERFDRLVKRYTAEFI